MEDKYKETRDFWDSIFDKKLKAESVQPLTIKELDKSVQWLCKDTKTLLDFGCAAGSLDFRCLKEDDVDYIKGIDLSPNAVKVANKAAKLNKIDNRAEFACGGVDALNNIMDNTFDGCILSNILDNLISEDALKVVQQIHRIVKPGGKVLVKFNPYLDKKTLEENNLKNIDKNLYIDSEGIYLLNLNDDEINKLLDPYFVIDRYETLVFENFNITNRIYYLYNRDDISTALSLEIDKLTETQAKQICCWKYEGIYSIYNYPSWDTVVKQKWGISINAKREREFASVVDNFKNLCGYIRFIEDEDHITIGLGLKPDLCGRGLGDKFMKLIISKSRQKFGEKKIILEVREFNKRAINCYKRVGFKIVDSYTKNTLIGKDNFIKMEYKF